MDVIDYQMTNLADAEEEYRFFCANAMLQRIFEDIDIDAQSNNISQSENVVKLFLFFIDKKQKQKESML